MNSPSHQTPVARADGIIAAQGLRAVLTRSLGWIGATRLAITAGVVVRYLLFARLLTPFDFGVIGAANFFEVLLVTISEPNFEPSLVPRLDDIDEYLDTVWMTSLARGILVALILIAMGPMVAKFFHIEGAYRVFWAYAPISTLIGAKSPASTSRLVRALDFHIAFVLNTAEQLAALIAGLAAIMWWRDWRGLVIAIYAGHAARTALTYWYYPYHPRLRFDVVRARQMFSYGRWMTLRGIAQFAARNLDNLTVGHVLGAAALGEYQMAFRLGEMPATELANGLGNVSFPLASRLSGRPASRGRLFAISSGAVALIGLVYMAFIVVRGNALISLTVGSKWLGALAPLRVFCLYGCVQGLITVTTSLLDGLGKPNLSFRFTLRSALALALLIYPLTALFGTTGAAAAVLASAAIALPLIFPLYRRASRDHQEALQPLADSIP